MGLSILTACPLRRRTTITRGVFSFGASILTHHGPPLPRASAKPRRVEPKSSSSIRVDPESAIKRILWLKVRPGGDVALALSMIHVLLEENLYDREFVRDWTNGAFLVREDNNQLLTAGDLSHSGDQDSYFVCNDCNGELVSYRPEQGYGRDGVLPGLKGNHNVTLSDDRVVGCRPSFDRLSAV